MAECVPKAADRRIMVLFRGEKSLNGAQACHSRRDHFLRDSTGHTLKSLESTDGSDGALVVPQETRGNCSAVVMKSSRWSVLALLMVESGWLLSSRLFEAFSIVCDE